MIIARNLFGDFVITSSVERERAISVSVVNSEGEAVGATVHVIVKGIEVGSFTLDAEHTEASIEIDEEFGEVDLKARSGIQTLTARLPIDARSHVFSFSTVLTRTRRGGHIVAEARCPDGTTGTPCVTCVVSGIPVRICV